MPQEEESTLSYPFEAERDACGIGFVADARGRSSRAIVEAALEALARVKHRGAVAADALSGDGSGLLLPIPRGLLAPEEGSDRAGLAMVFGRPGGSSDSRPVIEEACATEGLDVVGWREVPTDPGVLGERAAATLPSIEQAILLRPLGMDVEEGERRAFRARRRIQAAARERNVGVYVASLSFRTVTYKGLCAADRLADFYPDLADEACEGWFAIFHQRYSTNTAPTWERAQPFRFLAHNGEINTIRGNVALLKAREGHLGSDDLAPEDLLRPLVDTELSDSGILDEALELLVRGGRDVTHAAAMLVPPAWEHVIGTDPDVADFFHYHSCLFEPWDGPAGLVFTDGERVAAGLDRNGLRPLRVSVCEDGLVACSSETGAISTRGHGRVTRIKIGPGEAFCVDPSAGGVVLDAEIKSRLAQRRPYGDWVEGHLSRRDQGEPVEPGGERAVELVQRQVAAGYQKEEFTVVLRPMAIDGVEPTSSMGDDTAQPPLASYSRPLFSFLKQRFAQVTNPPIDHLRERHVMSLTTRLGRRAPLLQERPEAPSLREYRSPLLFPSEIAALESEGAVLLDATFPLDDGPDGLQSALERIVDRAAAAVADGARYLVVTDRAMDVDNVPVSAALAAGAVHHRLVGQGLRSLASIVVESDEPRDSHHLACLLTNGADAVCPRLALESLADLAKHGRLGGDVAASEAQKHYFKALEDGLLKIMSKMGISTLDSYRAAQIIEAMGLGPDVIDLCFTGVSSVLGGLSLVELGADALLRHDKAFGAKPVLANTGFIKFKKGGEYHAMNPDVVESLQQAVGLGADPLEAQRKAADELQQAVRTGDDEAYERFARLVNERPPTEPRDLLELVLAESPIPLDEVEPATAIARRFSTGAMSHGALSAEAHETLSIALNMIGGMANTGEGGEAPERYRDHRNSKIKQIASGRFGVTPEYLAFAEELQIKMAQGSKPGEGGQIPGKKVTVEIARLRHTVEGVALISPPPHHDIYSIEDLAQLIFDLKQANPRAKVSVKLVASDGVGTIAAGVVKGLADVVHISGGDGGTGASPLTSIKNAGMPWEIGLADAHASLVSNGLRGRARLRIDGGIKTGRDVMIAALMGADEISFGTAALLAEGCIMVRTCHRNTCPVGIATQDPKLRAKFAGTPEMVARYLLLVAEEARVLLSQLGLRSIEEAIGRTDLLRQRTTGNHRADSLDLGFLLNADLAGEETRFTGSLDIQQPRSDLGDRLYSDAMQALEAEREADLSYAITTSDRTVGARIGCAIGFELGARRSPHAVRASFEGEAGQSFGAFLADGIELTLVGEANDYVAKGMGGGRICIRPPENDGGDPYLVGNTVLYGATGGQLYIAGRAGERFAVRNSGAVAVVEGAGDHACEYMTAGAVVILGPTGRNLGAGMSGGEAYVYDPAGELEASLNRQLVDAYTPSEGQLESLRRIIERHRDYTGSKIAAEILDGWEELQGNFRRVAPVAEVARLEALFEGTAIAPA